VTWSDVDGLHFAQRSADGTWINSILDFGLSGVSTSPQVASNPNDENVAYLAWSQHSAGADETYYSQQNANGTWSAVQNLSNTSAESLISKLVVDPEGQLHVLWSETLSGVTDLLAISPRYSNATGSSSLAQVVTLPMTTSVPVVSFLYQLKHSSGDNNLGLEVQIHTDSATTTIFSATTDTVAWTHEWLNLSDWAGQTITLTFNVNEVMGTLPVWAYLDEVSLGSAHSDVWAALSAPTTVQPDDTLTYQLTYGNQGGAPAPATQLTLTLPAELTFVGASVPPLTTTAPLVWEVGELTAKSGPNTIVVTTTVPPTALSIITGTVSIATGATELEIANNAGQASTFIRYQVFLPLIRRQ
jgi:uncharacterized repeat protein (TIGR01451 family)